MPSKPSFHCLKVSCCPASQVVTCEASGELDAFLTQHRPSARESEQICVWRGGRINPSQPLAPKMKRCETFWPCQGRICAVRKTYKVSWKMEPDSRRLAP